MTEQELRESTAPTPNTIEELTAYIEALRKQEHSYDTCACAMSLSATATFNYMARQLDVTNFQASWADLDILRRTRRLKGPFALINGNEMLYPQYDFLNKTRELANEWRPWAAEEAARLLKEHGKFANPTVIAHWQWLAGQK